MLMRLAIYFLPYGLICLIHRLRFGFAEDVSLLHYPQTLKRIKRTIKFMLPYGLVMAFRRSKFGQSLAIKQYSLAERFVKIRFPAGASEFSCDFRAARANGRTAVFAMFSRNGCIPATTLYYLRGLSAAVDNIVVVSDCPLFRQEVEPLKDLIVCGIFARHKEYDFGSYRRGVDHVRNHPVLSTTKELVLCNDSCYGPVSPFADSFDRMKGSPCDFWGMCANTFYEWHLQSYWLVFRENVWKSAAFFDFLAEVKKEKTVKDVIMKYEIGLTARLRTNGFCGMACYTHSPREYSWLGVTDQNPTVRPMSLIEQGCPLVKVKALRDEACNLDGIGRTLSLIKGLNFELYETICRNITRDEARGTKKNERCQDEC